MLVAELESPENGERNDTYFLRERELLESDELDLSQQLLLHMKEGHICTITVREKGFEHEYERCYIEDGPDPDYCYLVPYIQGSSEAEGKSSPLRRILIAKTDIVRIEECR